MTEIYLFLTTFTKLVIEPSFLLNKIPNTNIHSSDIEKTINFVINKSFLLNDTITLAEIIIYSGQILSFNCSHESFIDQINNIIYSELPRLIFWTLKDYSYPKINGIHRFGLDLSSMPNKNNRTKNYKVIKERKKVSQGTFKRRKLIESIKIDLDSFLDDLAHDLVSIDIIFINDEEIGFTEFGKSVYKELRLMFSI